MKKEKRPTKELKKDILERYTISGLWQTMCGYIVFMFIKELLTNNYLIHFSVDVLIAIVSFYIMLNNLVNQFNLIKQTKVSKKPIIFQIVGFVVALFIVLITLKSPFDISFAILVAAFITNKKMFEKELNTVKL